MCFISLSSRYGIELFPECILSRDIRFCDSYFRRSFCVWQAYQILLFWNKKYLQFDKNVRNFISLFELHASLSLNGETFPDIIYSANKNISWYKQKINYTFCMFLTCLKFCFVTSKLDIWYWLCYILFWTLYVWSMLE